MEIMADLLVVVVYCLGVYTLLAVVAGLFEWWESRLRRKRSNSSFHYRLSLSMARGRVSQQVKDVEMQGG